MKGRISLKEFIHGVKNEIIDAAETSENPVAFEIVEVELEAAFALDAKAEGSFSLFVKLGGETSASQSHKVKLKLMPLKQKNEIDSISFEDPGKVKKNPTSKEDSDFSLITNAIGKRINDRYQISN